MLNMKITLTHVALGGAMYGGFFINLMSELSNKPSSFATTLFGALLGSFLFVVIFDHP